MSHGLDFECLRQIGRLSSWKTLAPLSAPQLASRSHQRVRNRRPRLGRVQELPRPSNAVLFWVWYGSFGEDSY